MTACLDKIGKIDPQGGPFYNGFDRVRMERVYTDTIEKKEKRCIKYSPFFNMNLMRPLEGPGRAQPRINHNRMDYIPEKVEKKTPAQRLELPPLDGYEIECIRHLERGPTQRFDVPTQASHEIGWVLDNPNNFARLQSTGGGLTRAPMLDRNQWKGDERERHLRRTQSMPGLMNGLLSQLNTPGTRPRRAKKVRSEVHAYAENYYNCMHANPFQKTQPIARTYAPPPPK